MKILQCYLSPDDDISPGNSKIEYLLLMVTDRLVVELVTVVVYIGPQNEM